MRRVTYQIKWDDISNTPMVIFIQIYEDYRKFSYLLLVTCLRNLLSGVWRIKLNGKMQEMRLWCFLLPTFKDMGESYLYQFEKFTT